MVETFIEGKCARCVIKRWCGKGILMLSVLGHLHYGVAIFVEKAMTSFLRSIFHEIKGQTLPME